MSVVELTPITPSRRRRNGSGLAVAELDFACRLTSGVLAVMGSTKGPARQLKGYRESTTAGTLPPAITFPLEASSSGWRTGFLSLVAGADLKRRRRLDLGPVRLTLDPKILEQRLITPGELIMRLSSLDPVSRQRCVDLLTSALSLCHDAPRVPLAKMLYEARETLRERLPSFPIDQKSPKALHIDALFGIDDRSFYVRGWMRNAEAEISSLVAVSPEGRRVDLTGRLVRYARPDVGAMYGGQGSRCLGFLGYFELPVPSILSGGWLFMMFDGAGGAVQATAPPVADDPLQVRSWLLADLVHDQTSERLIWQHTFPAVSRIQERLASKVKIAEICQFGPLPRSPEVSVVVPLYKRIDFLEHQMAHFLHDPQILSADLIYVLDSPEMAKELTSLARQLWGLYQIPFRMLLLDRNGGFSCANNAGASVARGKRLLLMNSDILPRRPGWLDTMAGFYSQTPNIGALGPKLIYEDGSLQHAGLYFRRSPETGCWHNAHHFQGLSGSFPNANVCRPVHCVTGACLMIDTELFHEAGGLKGIYVQGDFEDSDLCLRLRELGTSNWYLPEVELYHLEGQSYPGELRRATFRYNSWLHTLLWNNRIEEITEVSHD